MNNLKRHFDYGRHWWLFVLNTANFTALAAVVYFLFLKNAARQSVNGGGAFPGWRHFVVKYIGSTALILVALNLLWFLPALKGLAFLAAMPVALLWLFIVLKERQPVGKGLSRVFEMLGGAWQFLLGLYLLLLLICVIFFFLIDSPLVWSYFEIIRWNIAAEKATLNLIFAGFSAFLNVLTLNLVLPVLITGMGFLYFRQIEVKEAVDLRERIRQFGEMPAKSGMGEK